MIGLAPDVSGAMLGHAARPSASAQMRSASSKSSARSGRGSRPRRGAPGPHLIRHLTGDPPRQARRASAFLERADELLLPDLIAAEVVYVLESFYEVERPRVAELARAIVGFPAVVVVDEPLLLRALEVYEIERLDFAEAYLLASAEASGVGAIASFDRTIDRLSTVRRIEPS
jgi:predicted nucleic acid-binding protein